MRKRAIRNGGRLRRRILLLAVFPLALSAFARLGLTQASEEQALTSTKFRAPEFPDHSDDLPSSPSISPPPPNQNRPGAPGTSSTLNDDSLPSSTWINSLPLTMRQLVGKVVLIDFWEYTCINCIRTFAKNKKWYERYHKYGFEIIGVHDFEFDIAYHFPNVRAAVKRFDLNYPIFVDSDISALAGLSQRLLAQPFPRRCQRGCPFSQERRGRRCRV